MHCLMRVCSFIFYFQIFVDILYLYIKRNSNYKIKHVYCWHFSGLGENEMYRNCFCQLLILFGSVSGTLFKHLILFQLICLLLIALSNFLTFVYLSGVTTDRRVEGQNLNSLKSDTCQTKNCAGMFDGPTRFNITLLKMANRFYPAFIGLELRGLSEYLPRVQLSLELFVQ